MNDRTSSGGRKWWLAIAIVATCGLTTLLIWRWSVGRSPTYDDLAAGMRDPAEKPLDVEAEARIVRFCSDCHALPRPASFPRDAWYVEAQQGYLFYAKSGRNDLDVPPFHETLSYFRSRAPRALNVPVPMQSDRQLGANFEVRRWEHAAHKDVPAGVSHLSWVSVEADKSPVLLVTDMRRGDVSTLDLVPPSSHPRMLARLNHPAHAESCDLNGDGLRDIVVADLGGYYPDDHDRGRVVWLRASANGAPFDEVVLAEGLGRVADVRPADFDGDGDLDLIVAEFGMYLTGSITLLRNDSTPASGTRFVAQELDDRPGTIHVPVVDLNGDGRPDFLALVSQEYESVDAFINQGEMGFHRHTLWSADDLTFGSSGIEPIDMDGDGDTDILVTNGDAFDNRYLEPRHGIQWLENQGNLQFAEHRLADLPGAYRALPGDIDGDGDLDIIGVAWLPRNVFPENADRDALPSIVCLEQTERGDFAYHILESGSQYYASFVLADFDGDQDLDFAVGAHLPNVRVQPHWLAVWWNQVVDPADD